MAQRSEQAVTTLGDALRVAFESVGLVVEVDKKRSLLTTQERLPV